MNSQRIFRRRYVIRKPNRYVHMPPVAYVHIESRNCSIEIERRNKSFEHKDATMKDFNPSVRCHKGAMSAVVGVTGAGKSTLFQNDAGHGKNLITGTIAW